MTWHLNDSHLDRQFLGAEVTVSADASSPGAGDAKLPLVPAPLPVAGGKVNMAIVVGLSALAVILICRSLKGGK